MRLAAAGLRRPFAPTDRTVLEAIENSPARFPTALADIRKAKVPHFPYVVYFVALAEVTSVIAIIHRRRDPRRWQERR